LAAARHQCYTLRQIVNVDSIRSPIGDFKGTLFFRCFGENLSEQRSHGRPRPDIR
jgi:hypothetical protein